jgi:diacylglycerol kinase
MSFIKPVKRLIKSFGYAGSGLAHMVRTEQNARVHLVMTFLVVILGFLLHISLTEWCLVCLCIGSVWAAEAFNTAVETITDHLFKERNRTAKRIKDLSAGAVFVTAIAAAVCGLIIFLPKLWMLLTGAF